MNQEPYRVLPRAKAAGFGILLLAAAAVVVWVVIRWMNASTDNMVRLFEQSPEQAATEVVRRVRMYAWLYGGSLFGIAGWTAWIGLRAIRTERMPPPGSWIVEGQRTYEGSVAVRRGKLLLCFAAVLALLAGGLFVTLWRLAGTITVANDPDPPDLGVMQHDDGA